MRLLPMTAILPLVLAMPGEALAHHSFAAHFQMDRFAEAVGRVTDVQWTNPHVFIHIEDAAGERWEIELGPVNLLTRLGIEREMIVVGESLRARGNPGRQDERILWTSNILLADNTELVVNPRGEAYWAGANVGDPALFLEPERLAAVDERSFFRLWTPPISAFPRPAGDPVLTEQGIAAQAAYGIDTVAIGDCEDVGMPFAMISPYPLELYESGGNIIIKTESYDLERVIHFSAPAAEPAPSLLGFSRGRFEGDTLVIETDRIDFHSYGDQGPAQSPESRVVERLTLSASGAEMDYEILVEDAVMLAEPWRWAGRFVLRDDAELKPWRCGEEL